MILGSAFLIILYLILKYVIAWISYYNNIDSRLGDSTKVIGLSKIRPMQNKEDLAAFDDEVIDRFYAGEEIYPHSFTEEMGNNLL